MKREPLHREGRRIVLSRTGEEIAVAVSPAVAERIRVCLCAMSGLEPGPVIRAERPGSVRRILLAADDIANALEPQGDRPIDRRLRLLLGRFWCIRFDLAAAGPRSCEQEAEEQSFELAGREG